MPNTEIYRKIKLVKCFDCHTIMDEEKESYYCHKCGDFLCHDCYTNNNYCSDCKQYLDSLETS